jgi:predicted double-glycine peptidase
MGVAPRNLVEARHKLRRAAPAATACGRALGAGLVFVFLLILVSGRALAESKPVKTLLEFRHQNVVVQKFDLSCGAAALGTVLNFQFGDKVSEREINLGMIRRQEYIENPELVRVRQGFSLLDMKRFVDSRGYEGIGYGQLDIDDLIKFAPIIVPVSPVGYNHFVVFRGILRDQVLLADPAYGNRTMSREKFERIWIDFPELGKVGFVVTRRGQQAPPGALAPRAREFITLPPVRGSSMF